MPPIFPSIKARPKHQTYICFLHKSKYNRPNQASKCYYLKSHNHSPSSILCLLPGYLYSFTTSIAMWKSLLFYFSSYLPLSFLALVSHIHPAVHDTSRRPCHAALDDFFAIHLNIHFGHAARMSQTDNILIRRRVDNLIDDCA